MQFSKFGEKFNQYSGITQLMDDLNDGLRTPGAIMLGGGNPAAIPAMLEYFHQASENMLSNGKLLAALANYDGPQGKDVFVKALARLLKETYGWNISEKNISLTNGSQSGFFYLFNLFAGQQPDGSHKKILLPLAPEYIAMPMLGLMKTYLFLTVLKLSCSTMACSNTTLISNNSKWITLSLRFVPLAQPTQPVTC